MGARWSRGRRKSDAPELADVLPQVQGMMDAEDLARVCATHRAGRDGARVAMAQVKKLEVQAKRGNEVASLAKCVANGRLAGLRELCLSGSAPGTAEGARALAHALREDTSIRTLSFTSADVGDDGAKALAEALRANSALQALSLSNNAIRTAGAEALADALAVNRTLHTLHLENNFVGEDGARALALASADGRCPWGRAFVYV